MVFLGTGPADPAPRACRIAPRGKVNTLPTECRERAARGTSFRGVIRELWHPETTYLNTASFGLPPDPAWEALVTAQEDWRAGRFVLPPDDDGEFIPLPTTPVSAALSRLTVPGGGDCITAPLAKTWLGS